MNQHLRLALEALERGAAEARALSRRSPGELRNRLQRTVDDVLGHLMAEGGAEGASDQGGNVMSDLDRQSKDIAEELRRIEQLMKQRLDRD